MPSGWRSLRDCAHSPRIGTQPPGMALPRTAHCRSSFNRLRTGVRHFRSCLYKWDIPSSATCDCGTEEQTVDHVVLDCAIHQPPYGAHSRNSSGRGNNQMAAQHLPRDLVRPGSGLKEMLKRWRKCCAWAVVTSLQRTTGQSRALEWIRTIKNFFGLRLDPECKLFQKFRISTLFGLS